MMQRLLHIGSWSKPTFTAFPGKSVNMIKAGELKRYRQEGPWGQQKPLGSESLGATSDFMYLQLGTATRDAKATESS